MTDKYQLRSAAGDMITVIPLEVVPWRPMWDFKNEDLTSEDQTRILATARAIFKEIPPIIN